MSFRLPRAAGVVALACAASALSLPFAQPASAAAPVQKLFVAADAQPVGDLDTLSGLYTSTTPPTLDNPAVVPESTPVNIHGLSASADGSRVIYVQDNFSSSGPVSQQVVVRDVSTRVVRVLKTQAWDDIHFISTPVLSPDGLNAAWEIYNGDLDALTLVKASVSTGFVTTLKAGRSPYSFLDNSTLLVQDIDGTPSVVTLGGATGTISNLPVEALHATVSADKQHIAFGLFTTPDGSDTDTASMQVAPLTGGGLTWTVGSPVTLTSALYNDQPAFTPDSTKLYWTQNNGDFDAKGDIWSAPVDNSTPAAATATTATDENDVVVTTTDDGTAPGALPSVSPAVLKGTQADLAWTLPADTDLSGTRITRTLGATKKEFFIPGPATGVTSTLTDTGLALGSTYVYSIWAVDRSGHFGPASTLTLTALQAAPSTADPTSRASATTTFPVVFGPVSSETAKFTVDYVPTGGVTWTNWLTDYPDNTASFTGTAGTSYTFRVRVTDGSGNASPLVNSARAVVPFDQTKAAFTGGGNVYKPGTYLGSYRKLWHSTDVARVTLVGNRLQIVGNTCGTCGFFDIFDNGTWVAGVNTYGSVTRLRQVLFTKYYSGIASHSFSIKARGTGTRRDVMLDGFAMRT